MYLCYGLTAVSFFMLSAAAAQGYLGFTVLGIDHPRFAFLAALVYLFTQTLVMFFFIGTGLNVRDYAREHEEAAEYHRRSRALKGAVFPSIMLNMLFVTILVFAGAAVDTGRMRPGPHGALFAAALMHFLWTIRAQHRGYKEIVSVIVGMYGLEVGPANTGKPIS